MPPFLTDRPDEPQVGGWRLLDRLGAGSFGETWRAVDATGRVAAVKLTATPSTDEVRALASVCHPGVVAVLDAGGHPTPFIAMELARGVELGCLGAVAEAVAVHLGGALFDALDAVHTMGLCHGDIKPDNLMIDAHSDRPKMKIIDFGLVGVPRGGTLLYASPERLAGGVASPAADVYAAGLVVWELVHGSLPHAELPLETAMLRRREAPPRATAGPPWLRDLLARLLAQDVDARPSAAEAADVFAAHGVSLPAVDVAQVQRRVASQHLERAVDADLRGWIGDGGCLGLSGDRGCGKSHLIRWAGLELSARGMAWVQLHAGRPWQAIEEALGDPRLPGEPASLPDTQDLEDRAYAAAQRLGRRAEGRLHVLVDELDRMDAGTLKVLDHLARRDDVALLLAGSSFPEWCTDVIRLEPWSRDDVHRLCRQWLGVARGSVAELAERAFSDGGGSPGVASAVVVEAVARGAVARRAGHWLVDVDRLDGVVALTDHSDWALSADARAVGAALACFDASVDFATLLRLVSRSDDVVAGALVELADRGLVQQDGDRVRVATRATRDGLLAQAGDLTDVHARVCSELGDASGPRLVWHLAGARHLDRLTEVAPQAIEAEAARDGGAAATLADAVWKVLATEPVARARIMALVRAGRAQEAVVFVDACLERFGGAPSLLLAGAEALLASSEPARARDMARRARAAERGRASTLALACVEAQACFRMGEHGEALAVARQALRGRPPGQAQLDDWLRLHGILAQSLHALGDLSGAISCLEGLRDVGDGRAARSLLDGMLGRLLWHAGRVREAARIMARAARRRSGLGSLDRARLANNAGLASYGGGDLLAAVDGWERAQLLFERMGATTDLVATRLNLCVGYTELGRWERARQAGEWARDTARATGDVDNEVLAVGNLGDLARAVGVPLDAMACYHQAIADAEQHGLTGQLVENLRRAVVLAVEASLPDAESLIERALAAATEATDTAEQGLVLAWRAVLRAQRSESSAKDDLAHARSLLVSGSDARCINEWRWCAALVHSALGDRVRAMQEVAKFSVYADESSSAWLKTRARDLTHELGGREATRAADSAVFDLCIALGRQPEPEVFLQQLVATARTLCDAERAFVLDRDGSVVVMAHVPGDEGGTRPASSSIAARAIEENRSIIVADMGDRPDLRSSTSVVVLALSSVMCVPIPAHDRVVGALYVDSRRASEQQLGEVARHLSALAGLAGQAMEQAAHRREALQQEHRAKGLAHDLRNLIQVVHGVVGELEDRVEDPAVEASLVDLSRVSGQMIRMTHDYLAGGTGQVERVSVRTLSRELMSLLRLEAAAKGVTLRLESADVDVRSAPDELRRALFNLLHNALRHTRPGTTVSVRVEDTGRLVRWRVHDQGPGIEPELLPRIFEPGVRSESGGFGLGLAIAASAVQAAGGSVSARNHPDGGAVFEVTLPHWAESVAHVH